MPKEPVSPFDFLGDHVKDIQLDFPGIAIGYREDLHGCNHILIEPSELLFDGSVDKSISVDEQRVQWVKKGPSRGKIVRAKIPLGSRVSHKINGYSGVVTSRLTWVNHKPTADVEPTTRGKNGEVLSPERFDEDMLEIVEPGEPKFSDTYKKRMGMAPEPTAEQKKRGKGGPRETHGRMSCMR